MEGRSDPVNGRRTAGAGTEERRPPRQLVVLVVLLVLTLGLLIPHLTDRYHTWSLHRMSPTQRSRYVKVHPDDLDAAYLQAMDDVRAGRLRVGSAELLQVFRRDPTRTHILNDYAVALMAQQRNLEALQALTGLLKVDPDYAPAWANLGRLHLLKDMPFTAAAELKRSAQLDPHSMNTFLDLGTAYQQSMNYREALTAYEAARRIDQNNADAEVGLAQAYQSLSNADAASKIIEDAARRHPGNVPVLATLGAVRLERASTPLQIASAIPPLERAVALSPDNVPILFNLGVAYRRLGRYPDAIEVLEDALKVSPGYPPALYQLSQAMLASGRRSEGERLGEEFRLGSARAKLQSGLEGRIEQNSGDLDARFGLAQIYLAEHRFEEAALQCREILLAKPSDKDARRLLVRVALAAQYSPSTLGP